MIRQESDGRWLAECDLCTWETVEADKQTARKRLTNHINEVHKTRKRQIKKQPRISPEEKPPQVPKPVSEHS